MLRLASIHFNDNVVKSASSNLINRGKEILEELAPSVRAMNMQEQCLSWLSSFEGSSDTSYQEVASSDGPSETIGQPIASSPVMQKSQACDHVVQDL